jgi:uncharacterized protein (TIGR03435 family)
MRIAAALLLTAGAALAQPAFEVASIRAATPYTGEDLRAGRMPRTGVTVDGAQAKFLGMYLDALVARAYGVKTFQITVPEGSRSGPYDIVAKMPAGSSPDQIPQMLQALLAERFKLKLRTETKEFPVYALVAGKDGAKLTPRPADYDPAVKSPVRPITLDAYAQMAAIGLDRPVVNLTGLEGEYLLSTTELMRAGMRERMARLSPSAQQEGGPNVFAIVQTLGLKLEPRKLALPHLVIEHAEKTPVEN